MTTLRFVALCFFIALALLSYFSLGAEFNPGKQYYVLEYAKSPTEDSPSILDVIFNSEVAPKIAEQFLRQQITYAIEYRKPLADIQAFAWYQSPNQSSEKPIIFPDGSSYLIYKLKTKKILLSKEYEASLIGEPETGKEIKVFFKILAERDKSGDLRVIGETNLPDQMELMISLNNENVKFFAQTTVKVNKGSFETEWFNNKGKALPHGKYEIGITTALVDFQPNSVKKIIGERGENLSGEAIKINYGQNLIDYSITQTVD